MKLRTARRIGNPMLERIAIVNLLRQKYVYQLKGKSESECPRRRWSDVIALGKVKQ